MSKQQAVIRIQRTSPNTRNCPSEEFVVDFEPDMKVLDALRIIQQQFDSALSFRWECRSGICGTCAVMVNDQPQLSCEATLEPGKVITVRPLEGFPVLKDLLVDVTPALDRLGRLEPFLVPPDGAMPVVRKREADRSKQFRRCIECFACVAALAPYSSGQGIDPLGIVKLARFATDPRDCLDRKALAGAAGIQMYAREQLSAASAVCPKHIDIAQAYDVLTASSEEPRE